LCLTPITVQEQAITRADNRHHAPGKRVLTSLSPLSKSYHRQHVKDLVQQADLGWAIMLKSHNKAPPNGKKLTIKPLKCEMEVVALCYKSPMCAAADSIPLPALVQCAR
jgi:hypothetical protein